MTELWKRLQGEQYVRENKPVQQETEEDKFLESELQEMDEQEDFRNHFFDEPNVSDLYEKSRNGDRGSASDKDILKMIDDLRSSERSADDKYDGLDALWFYTINNHVDGRCAEVLKNVEDAQEVYRSEIFNRKD